MAGYTPQTWSDNNASFPVSAARMAVLEDGVYRAHPQVVASLPTVSIFDGMEVVVRVPTRAQTFEAFWKFRHDASNSTAQTWAFIGGAPAGDEIIAFFSTASTVYVADGTNGPQLNVPFLGMYAVTYGMTMANNTVGATCVASLSYGAAPVAADQETFVAPTANAQTSVSKTRVITVTSLNQLIQVQYGVTAGTGTFSNRFMYVTPIRCGP